MIKILTFFENFSQRLVRQLSRVFMIFKILICFKCTEIKILNSGSHDISQKLRQTKCILFKIWRLKCTIIPKKAIWPSGNLAKMVFWSILSLKKWKSKHLLCLSFWDMSCDPEFRILISVQKMWPLVEWYQKDLHCVITPQNLVTILDISRFFVLKSIHN